MVIGATASLQSYVYSAKANAVKEVASWASDFAGNARDSAVRSTGQIVDNVTEGRLLKTKVMELSKERYKFMIQSDYDKKFFVEGQQRKLKAMPDLLRDIDLSYWLSKKRKRKSTANTPNARKFAYLKRVASLHQEAAKLACSASTPVPACLRESGASDRAIAGRQPRLTSSLSAAAGQQHLLARAVQFSEDPSLSSIIPLQFRRRQTVASITVSGSLRDQQLAAVDRRACSGSAVRSRSGVGVVADVRYRRLEDSLTDSYESACPMDVAAIVDTLEALHVPSAAATKYTKPKLGAHIIEYLRERKLLP